MKMTCELCICETSDLAHLNVNDDFFCDRPEFQSKQKIKLVTPSFDYIYFDLPFFYLLCIQNTNHLIATLCKMTSSINHFCISPFKNNFGEAMSLRNNLGEIRRGKEK